MPDAAPALDPSVRATLQKLADIAVPPPVSLVPQTWGWAALAVIIAAFLVWAAWHWQRRRKANRYRTEALAELDAIEQSAARDPAALAAIPPLLKRVALAAWPRQRVAALTQKSWTDFLAASERAPALPEPLAGLLNDAEYRASAELKSVGPGDIQTYVRVARRWIEAHRVSA